jgi:hypothetical protein
MRSIYLLLFLVIPIAASANPYQDQIVAEKAFPLPSCEGLPLDSEIRCLLVREAQDRARTIPLAVYQGQRKNVMREAVLIVRDVAGETFRDIVFEMEIGRKMPPGCTPMRVKTEHQPPYTVKWCAGETYLKAQFEVLMGDVPLYPYTAKFLEIPAGVSVSNLAAVRAHAEPVIHLSVHEHLNDRGMAEKAFNYVRSVIEPVHERARAIRSRSDPAKSVAEIFSLDELTRYVPMEQTDHDRLFGKGWYRYLEGIEDPLEIDEVRMVYANIFQNGTHFYSNVKSKADAYGIKQFTNKSGIDKKGRRTLGTYDLVRTEYKEADLDPDFRRGTRSVRNSALAALLLLDYELAKCSSFFKKADTELLKLCAATAYNSGAFRARQVADFLSHRGVHAVEMIPWDVLLRTLESTRFVPRETVGYARKHEVFRRLQANDRYTVE